MSRADPRADPAPADRRVSDVRFVPGGVPPAGRLVRGERNTAGAVPPSHSPCAAANASSSLSLNRTLTMQGGSRSLSTAAATGELRGQAGCPRQSAVQAGPRAPALPAPALPARRDGAAYGVSIRRWRPWDSSPEALRRCGNSLSRATKRQPMYSKGPIAFCQTTSTTRFTSSSAKCV